MKTIITLTIEHKNPIPDLLDKVAGRAYTLDGVDDATAAFNELKSSLESRDFYELMQAYRHEPIDASKPFESVKEWILNPSYEYK